MPEPMPALIESLRRAVGAAHVLTEGDLGAYEQDWRRRRTGKALAVVRPANAAEVAAVVRCCAQAGVAIVPQGGNTSLSVGSTPDGSGSEVVLSLTRMNAVRGRVRAGASPARRRSARHRSTHGPRQRLGARRRGGRWVGS